MGRADAGRRPVPTGKGKVRSAESAVRHIKAFATENRSRIHGAGAVVCVKGYGMDVPDPESDSRQRYGRLVPLGPKPIGGDAEIKLPVVKVGARPYGQPSV